MLQTFLTLRFLPIQKDAAYWEQYPTPVLKRLIDECFQAVTSEPDCRETHLWTIKSIFLYINPNEGCIRRELLRILTEYYTEYPGELAASGPGQKPTTFTLHKHITSAASGGSFTLKT